MAVRSALLLICLTVAVADVSGGQQNIVSQWNELLGIAVKAAGMFPPESTRLYASMHQGMKRIYDLVYRNSADPSCADRDTLAISIAAHFIIGGNLPSARAMTDALMRSIWVSSRCDAKSKVFYNQLAMTAAMAVLTERANDNSNCFTHYTPPPEYSAWQMTNQKFPILPCWGNTTLFAGVVNSARFLPPGPPDPTTPEFARNWQEVFVMGKKVSSIRTAFQTEEAILWDPPIFVAFLNKIVADVLASDPRTANSLRAHLDIFYLANSASANAAIVVWKAKYLWNLWRPVQSNRVGMAQRPDMPTDPNWESLLPTPPFPEYTSGHSAIGSGMLVVLKELLGDQHSFVVTDGVYSHAYSTLSAAMRANEDSRYNGGVHWRFSGVHSAAIGRAMAYEVLKLNPIEGFPWDCPPDT